MRGDKLARARAVRDAQFGALGAFDTARSLGRDDAARLQSWGFNVVRLGVMWPAVMPAEGVVNTTYLDEVRSMIEMLHEFGVETLVDLHQDVLSPYTCGEGMPDWAYLKALDAVGFDRTGPRAFPAPLKLDLPIDAETGYADTHACVVSPWWWDRVAAAGGA